MSPPVILTWIKSNNKIKNSCPKEQSFECHWTRAASIPWLAELLAALCVGSGEHTERFKAQSPIRARARGSEQEHLPTVSLETPGYSEDWQPAEQVPTENIVQHSATFQKRLTTVQFQYSYKRLQPGLVKETSKHLFVTTVARVCLTKWRGRRRLMKSFKCWRKVEVFIEVSNFEYLWQASFELLKFKQWLQ